MRVTEKEGNFLPSLCPHFLLPLASCRSKRNKVCWTENMCCGMSHHKEKINKIGVSTDDGKGPYMILMLVISQIMDSQDG